MKISVIVPVYNTAEFLTRCLESLVYQTYSNLEVIIVNDGSSDNSQDIIDEFVLRFPQKIIAFQQKNSGQSIARNFAIDKVTGEYFTFVDSDDWLELNTLELLYQSILINNSDIAVCNINFYNQDIPEKSNFLEVFEKNKYLAQKFCWGKLYKTKFWNDHKFKFIDGIFYEDLELVPKILLATNKISIVQEWIYNYELRNQISTTKTKKKSSYIFLIFNSLISFYESKSFDRLFEQFLLSMLISIFLEEYETINNTKVSELIVANQEIFQFSNCTNYNQKFIVFCIKSRLPLSFIYFLVNLRRYIKKSKKWN